MKCAWQELMRVLPPWLAREVDVRVSDTLEELRLRLGQSPELVCSGIVHWLKRCVTVDDLNFCINTASRYSPWSSQSVAQGYITAPGGHRIGLCGQAVVREGTMSGIRSVTSLCIRVARDFPGIGTEAAKRKGSILLIGPPGSGKTTLLRDIIRQISKTETVAVVDERGELFPEGLDRGLRLDILSGCPKGSGIDTVLRTMGPGAIAVDEITAESDCEALLRAGWCGVRLLATAHAASVQDLRSRKVYGPLVTNRLFNHILVLSRDKSWREERMDI